ncbi:MAG: PspA/IM30 family protein [Elusimicrobiales bacterium]
MNFNINQNDNENEKRNNLNIPFSKESNTGKKGFSFNKIKGTSSFVERLKNVSKRDISYFIVGVSMLILAPVAEYFLSKPNANTSLTPGFGERRSSDSAGIYEPGVNALSAGSPDGLEEVVAPLTARDPSSLILGAQKEPPPQIPYTPPQETKRDSIADIAKKSFSEATKSSPAPFIPPKMSASLRGASSFFGGGESSRTGGSLAGGKIMADAKSAPSQAQKKSMLGPQAIPGYKGVASQSDSSVNKGAFEKLRTQADKAAGYFSGADAKQSLDNAAAAAINPTGGGGFGALQDGGRNTNPSGSNTRGSYSYSPGDPCRGSIESQLACENARKANDFKNFLRYDLPKQLIQSAFDNLISKGIMAPLGEKIANSTKSLLNPTPPSPSPQTKYCWIDRNKKVAITINKDNNGNMQLVPPVSISDCPCGYLTTEPYPDCGGGSTANPSGGNPVSGGDQTANSGTGSSSNNTNTSPGGVNSGNTSAQIPSDIKSDIENYDALLVKAIESANKGREATKVNELKENAKAVAENLEQAVSLAQKISNTNVAKIDSTNFKKIGEYKTAITEVESKVRTLKEDYMKFSQDMDSFKATLEKAIADYKAGKIKPKLAEGVSAETLGGSEITVKLEDAKKKVEKIKKDSELVRDEYLVKFENRVRSHNAAYSWYVNQIKLAKESNRNVYSQSGSDASQINSAKAQIMQVPDNAADENTIGTLKQVFSALTGLVPQNVSVQQNPPQTMLVKYENGVFRMSASSNENKIDKMLGWRSADKEQAWAGKINDSAIIEQDKKNFDSVKPTVKLSKGEFAQSYGNLPIDNSFVVSIVRAMNVDKDVEEAKKLVAGVLDGLDGFNTMIGANKTDLESIKTDLKPLLDQLKPVEQPKPKPKPKPNTTTSGSGGKTSQSQQQQVVVQVNVVNNVSAASNSNSGVQVIKKK